MLVFAINEIAKTVVGDFCFPVSKKSESLLIAADEKACFIEDKDAAGKGIEKRSE